MNQHWIGKYINIIFRDRDEDDFLQAILVDIYPAGIEVDSDGYLTFIPYTAITYVERVEIE